MKESHTFTWIVIPLSEHQKRSGFEVTDNISSDMMNMECPGDLPGAFQKQLGLKVRSSGGSSLDRDGEVISEHQSLVVMSSPRRYMQWRRGPGIERREHQRSQKRRRKNLCRSLRGASREAEGDQQ